MVKQGRPLKQSKKVQLFVYVDPSIKDAITDTSIKFNFKLLLCSMQYIKVVLPAENRSKTQKYRPARNRLKTIIIKTAV